MSAHPNYQEIYGVGLLDDLHNYFPALLYEQGRFQNLTQVFHYVRHQMNSRFNLYSYGAAQARATAATAATAAAQGAADEISFLRTTIPVSPAGANTHTILVDLLSSFLAPEAPASVGGAGAGPTPLWTSFRQPVVVRPSLETINRATQLVSGTSIPAESNCAICQDRIEQTDTARKIVACQHMYHQHCIDRWFLRSVLCPTCRHDIREGRRTPLLAPAAAPAASASSAASAASQQEQEQAPAAQSPPSPMS
jgi:hypothetical protein